MPDKTPQQPRLISYYGDDFTGSTDVMEALALHGLDAVLFTRIPSAEEFAPFAGYQAFGLAGTSRSETPDWMDKNLPSAFAFLKALEARFCHYKVCSTFDSSPEVGSIGRAIEIGSTVFNQAMVPLIVGAPQLRRFTFAGNLFANYLGQIYRIDRHPVMGIHPVTPMREADLRLHLGAQTGLAVALAENDWPRAGVALIDVHDSETQLAAGQKLLDLSGGFLAGSSGVEYALMKAMVQRGMITGAAHFPPLARVDQTIVVSGSVSPTTERQIRHALGHGFVAVPVSAVDLAQDDGATLGRAVDAALGVLAQGQSPIIHTALGPATDEGERLRLIPDARRKIGESLGDILKAVMTRVKLRRVFVAGGDSSSHALGRLDVYALTTCAPLPATPGSPMCHAFSRSTDIDGFEIALKGDQIGADDYFSGLRDGKIGP